MGLRPFLQPYSEGKKYSVSLSPDGGQSRCLDVKPLPPSPTETGRSWGLELQPRASALPRLETSRRSGLEVVPSARPPSTYAQRKVLRTPNGRPPPAPSARPRRPCPAEPRQLRAHPSAGSARRDRALAAPGPAPPRASTVPGWRGGGLGGAWKREPRKIPQRGWSRSSLCSGDSSSSSARPELVWSRPARASQKSVQT